MTLPFSMATGSFLRKNGECDPPDRSGTSGPSGHHGPLAHGTFTFHGLPQWDNLLDGALVAILELGYFAKTLPFQRCWLPAFVNSTSNGLRLKKQWSVILDRLPEGSCQILALRVCGSRDRIVVSSGSPLGCSGHSTPSEGVPGHGVGRCGAQQPKTLLGGAGHSHAGCFNQARR